MAGGRGSYGGCFGIGLLVDHLKSRAGPARVEQGLISWVSGICGALEENAQGDRTGGTRPWQAPITQIREIHVGGDVPTNYRSRLSSKDLDDAAGGCGIRLAVAGCGWRLRDGAVPVRCDVPARPLGKQFALAQNSRTQGSTSKAPRGRASSIP